MKTTILLAVLLAIGFQSFKDTPYYKQIVSAEPDQRVLTTMRSLSDYAEHLATGKTHEPEKTAEKLFCVGAGYALDAYEDRAGKIVVTSLTPRKVSGCIYAGI